jgi:tetratricopeptide (TPR) repeat protein
MFKLKQLSKEAIPDALEKAQCYRFLNESVEAESICLDILEADPQNQRALAILILALTDQFQSELNPAFSKARELLARLKDEYCQNYYEGIICERRAKAHLGGGALGSGHIAYDWFRRAMKAYEKAIERRLAGNDDAVLRWNACARTIMRHSEVVPADRKTAEQMLE